MRASFGWECTREGNDGVVVEHRPDGTSFKWRMAAFLVPAFIRGRRALISWKMRNLMSAQEVPTEDYSFLKEPHDDVLQHSNSRLESGDPRRWGADPIIDDAKG